MTPDRTAIINELQQIRSGMQGYHAHKENAAYLALAFSIAIAQFVTAGNASTPLIWSAPVVITGIHLFMRWQLLRRRFASTMSWATEQSIRELLAGTERENDLDVRRWDAPRRCLWRKKYLKSLDASAPKKMFLRKYVAGESLSRWDIVGSDNFRIVHRYLWQAVRKQERKSSAERRRRFFGGSLQGPELPTFANIVIWFYLIGYALSTLYVTKEIVKSLTEVIWC